MGKSIHGLASRSDLAEAAAAGGHHELELLEVDEAVAVAVDAVNHAAALRDGGGLPEAAQHLRELGGGDGPVAVGVEYPERVAQVLLDGRVVARGDGVDGRELGEADVAVAVRVGLLHHARHLVVRGRVAHALEQRRQLRPRDPPVPVRVELPEHALHLVLRRRPRGPLAGRGRRRRRRLGPAVAGEERPHLAHGGVSVSVSVCLNARATEVVCGRCLGAIDLVIRKREFVNAIAIWQIMVSEAGLIPNLSMYNAIIDLCCSVTNTDYALRMLDEMPFNGVFADSDTYNAILEGLIKQLKAREAEAFLAEMSKNEQLPSASNCAAAISMFSKEFNPSAAIDVWRCIVEHQITPAEDSARELIAGLLDFGRFAEVKKYIDEMFDMGIELPQSTIENMKHAFDKAGKHHTYDHIARRLKRH